MRRKKSKAPRQSMGQCEPLPRFLERSIARNVFPGVDGIEYLNAGSNDVRRGDVVFLGGKRFELTDFTASGEATLEGPWTLRFPMCAIPHDECTPILNSVAIKAAERRRAMQVRHDSSKSMREVFRRDKRKQWNARLHGRRTWLTRRQVHWARDPLNLEESIIVLSAATLVSLAMRRNPN